MIDPMDWPGKDALRRYGWGPVMQVREKNKDGGLDGVYDVIGVIYSKTMLIYERHLFRLRSVLGKILTKRVEHVIQR